VVASELVACGVPRMAAEAMEVHPRDAQVVARGCALLAALARGGLTAATPVPSESFATSRGSDRFDGDSLGGDVREALARGAEGIAGVRGEGAGDACCAAIAGALRRHGGDPEVDLQL
jgi:hypothetical protein